MERKSFAPQQLGPQTFPSNPDTNEGLPTPIEGTAINQHDGPDRTNADIEEFGKNYVGDNSTTLRDMIDAVRRQKENAEKSVDGIVVIPAAPRQASGDEMSNSVYSKIVAGLKRLAEDAEVSKETGEPITEPRPVYKEVDVETPEEKKAREEAEAAAASDKTRQEYEAELARVVKERKDFEAQQKDESRAEIKERFGDPVSQTRQQGPKDLNLEEAPVIPVPKAAPGADDLARQTSELLQNKIEMAQLVKAIINEQETNFRRTSVLRKAMEPLQALKAGDKIGFDRYNKNRPALDKIDEKLIAFGPGTMKVTLHGEAGPMDRIKKVSGDIDSLDVEGLGRAINNPEALSKVLDGLVASSEFPEEAKDRAKKAADLMKKNGPRLKKAFVMFSGWLKEKLKDTKTASAKISKLYVLAGPKLDELNKSVEDARLRAKQYNQAIAEITSEGKVTAEQLEEAKREVAEIEAMLDSILESSASFSGDAGEKTASSAIPFARMAAKSFEAIGTGISKLKADVVEMMPGFEILDHAKDIAAALSDAVDAMAGVGEVLDEMEPFVSALVKDASATDEVMAAPAGEADDVSSYSQPQPSMKDRIMDGLRGLVPPPQQMAGPQLAYSASADVVMGKTSKKVTKKKDADLPQELAPASDASVEDLKKPFLSADELAKAKLPADKALANVERKEKRKEKAAATPEAEAKQAAADSKKAREAIVSRLIGPEVINELAADHNLFRETVKQSGEIFKELVNIQDAGEAKLAPEYTAERAKEEGDEAASHLLRIKTFKSRLKEMAKKNLDMNEKFAKALEAFVPEKDKNFKNYIVMIEDLFKVTLSMERDQAILDNPDVAANVKRSLSALLDLFKKDAPKMKDIADVQLPAELKKFAELLGKVSIRGYSASKKRNAEEVAYVAKTVAPAGEEAKKEVTEALPYTTAPLQAVDPEAKPPTQASVQGMMRTAEEMDKEDAEVIAEMETLLAAFPKAIKDAQRFSAMLDGLYEFAALIEAPANELIAAVKSAPAAEAAPEVEEGGWGAVADDVMSLAKEWGGKAMDAASDIARSLVPPVQQPAYARSSKEDEMKRIAGDFDQFDTSTNRLEIVEGEDGKRRLVLNKGLKSLVSRKVQEALVGGYKCGDSVQVDMIDYVGFGTVKAYLGKGVYRVEVDGAVMEVPAKNVLGLDGNPWRA